MCRWPVLAWFSMLTLGCASSSTVVAGLTNAPQLGGASAVAVAGSPADPGSDVVSNGVESCESVSGRSPLRGHLPRCPTVSYQVPLVPELAVAAPGPGLVVPWLQHFYVGFPCHHAPATAGEGEHGALALASSVPVSASSPEGACAADESLR